MSELDFLLELLLNHKLPRDTQLTIKERIALIQQAVPTRAVIQRQPDKPATEVNGQAPSMQAKIAAMEAEKAMQNGQMSGQHPTVQAPPIPAPPQPQSPGAAHALMDRQRLINESLNENGGNFVPGRKAPRKF